MINSKAPLWIPYIAHYTRKPEPPLALPPRLCAIRLKTRTEAHQHGNGDNGDNAECQVKGAWLMARTKHDILWQRLKALLSGEMEARRLNVTGYRDLTGEQLIRIHEQMHFAAWVKGEMERMEAEYTENE